MTEKTTQAAGCLSHLTAELESLGLLTNENTKYGSKKPLFPDLKDPSIPRFNFFMGV